MIFNGKNILSGFPDAMTKVVAFLNEKASSGEFVFGDSFSVWEDNEDVIRPLGFGYEADNYYFAVGLAYIATTKNGNIDIPTDINLWRWAWSLNLLADVANWQPDFMSRVVKSFAGKKDDIDDLLKGAAQTYARKDFEKGQLLKDELPAFEIGISAGLMENDFQRYCDTYLPQQNEKLFTEAYCSANILSEKNHKVAFDIAMTFLDFTSLNAMTFLMKAQTKLQGERKTTCEDRIKELLEMGDTSKYVNPFCNWAIRNNDQEQFVEDVALLLIEGLGAENVNTLGAIDHAIVLRDKEPERLVRIVLKVAEVFSPLDVLKMGNSLHHLSGKKEIFSELVLFLIIHSNGEYRLLGRRLWDEYHLETYDIDVAKMDETVQCAFAYSMLQDYGNPETRLPKLLPLIKSDNKKVKKFVMGVLHPYTDDYMGHVIKALDNLKIKGKDAKMIKGYVDGRFKVIQERRNMKELWPSYTYGKEFKEARRVEAEHLQSKMKEAEANHHSVWADFAKTVVLARGGGWRNADGTTQKLPLIQFTAPARLLTESLSPREQETWLNDLLKNWDDTARSH